MKSRTWRVDLATDLAPPRTTADGVIYTGRAARTGDHEYPWGVERRDAAELERIAGQMAGKPLVLLHPEGGRVSPDTATCGRVLSARTDGDHVIVEVLVTDPAVAAEVAAGTRELSLGYDVRVDDEGWHHDTEVDHLAIVPRARCGSTCALRADARECRCGGAAPTPCNARRGMLHDHAHRGQDMDPEELKKQIAALEAERDALKARIDSVEAERDAAVTRADAAERARADAAAVHPAAVAARVKLEREAGAILVGADGKPVDVSAMSDRAIRVAVVKRADGFDCDEQKKSDVYVEARYDAVVGRPNPLAGLVPAGAVRSDADDLPDPEAAQRAMIERTRNASKVK